MTRKYRSTCSSLKLSLTLALSSALMTIVSYASPLPGTQEWDSNFDGKKALEHVRVLASDSLRGRYSGFDGADKANRYIAEHFDRLELEPPWGRDGYMHRFNYGAAEYTMPAGLIARFPDGSTDTAHFWQELNVFKYSGFSKVSGKLVFVGYGISSPENGWDDYAGLDVKDAVVLAWRGVPPGEEKDWLGWGLSGRKSSFALEKGAVGFIYCESDPPKWATISDEFFREDLPAMWVSKTFADSLLKGTGRTKDEWKRHADSTLAPVSQILDVAIEMQVSGKYYPKRKTQNIAGLWLGSDPILRNEIVVIGAHMDHHGVDPVGNLYPGADDNASGTATMMELARVFVENKVRLKRSVMFIGFAAEEEGLYGSKAFVKEMRLPKGMEVVAMLNMDMVGQGNCSLGVAGISEFPVLGEVLFADWPDSALKSLEFWGLWEGSDHASFRNAGIPSYVIGARGDHPNYHTPGDSTGNINPAVMKSTGDMMFHCAKALADYPQSMRPLVSRSEWLIRKYGGIKRKTLALESIYWVGGKSDDIYSIENKINRQSMVEGSKGKVKGVDYPSPLILYSVEGPCPESDRDRIGVNPYLQGMELIRGWAEAQGLPFLADSSLKGYLGEPFRGVSIMVHHTDLPADSLLVKTLSREGLGFVRGWYSPFDDEPFPMEDGYDERTGTNYPGWRDIALTARKSGVHVWLNAVNTHGDQTIEKLPKAFSDIWNGQVICDFSAERYPLPKGVESLLHLGWFVIIRDASFIDTIRYTPEWRQIGIPADPQLIDTLLHRGFREEEIGQLLFTNLQRTLEQWKQREDHTQP